MNKKILLFLLMLMPLVTSAQTSRTIHVATAGTLSDYISEDEKYQIEELTLSGELNGTDIRFIRNMSGIDYEERYMDVSDPYEDINTAGKLKTLDISNVKIVGGEVYYCCTTGTARYKCYSSVDDVISAYMFRGCKLTSIIIPNSVTSIDYYAFAWCSGLTSVTISNSVTSIGGYAFCCSGLTAINIPSSVTSIGNSAFSGCSDLTSITIPNSVTSIGSYAFESTGWYDNQPDGLVYAGNVAYKYKGTMPNNTSITIKDGTVGISEGAFADCTGLTAINIPSSVTSIGNSAFAHCSGLTAINIPSSVTSIGNSAFAYCRGLTSITIPNSVTSIEGSAFYGCSGLTSITISNSVTSIGSEAFCGCSGLTSITIPSSVTSIEWGAFINCSSLTTIVSEIENPFVINDDVFSCYGKDIYATATLFVPPSKKSAYQNTAGWKKFQNIVEAGQGGIIGYKFEADGIRYEIGEYNCVTVIPNGYSGDIVIPNQVTFNGCNYTVTSIRYYAFEGCNGLKSVIIPNSVTYIGSSAFCDCNDLDYIYIPSSVTYIGSYAFDGWHGHAIYITDLEAWCRIHFEDVYANPLRLGILYLNGSEIKDLVIPSSITSIGNYAFIGYRGTSITIPDGVTSIGHMAFSDCRGLETITSEIQNPFAIEDNVFECSDKDIFATATLIVPSGKKSVYQNTAGWNKFQKIVELGGVGYVFEFNGINYKIGENNTVSVVSKDAKYSGDVVIPSQVSYNGSNYNVTAIGNSAFEGCVDLTSVSLPNSLTRIGKGAFWECSSLKSVVIPDGVTTIGEGAFRNCFNLVSVDIPNSVTSIGSSAFSNCDNLTQISSGIENPFAIDDSVFPASVYNNASLLVPSGKKSAYQNTAGWKRFQNIVEASVVGKVFEANGVRYKIGENNTVSVTSKPEKYTGAVSIPNQVYYNGTDYSVTSIGNSAFEGCVDLTSVSLPSSLTRIGKGAFWECSSLKSVVVPDGVTTIGEGAFRNCFNLVSVDIPNSVTSIGGNAFSNCNNLTQISSGIENPFAIDDSVFPTSVYNNASLFIPSGKKSAYQNTAGWKRFQNIYYADGIYTLTYYVDGEEYKSVTYSSGAGITPEPEPTKEGYTFSGWIDLPETMPDHDVTVTGTFTLNKYKLTYKVDGEVYQTYLLEYGATITPEAEPTKDGYTFSGWSYIPEKMPAEEVNIFGSFTINQYTITYIIDGEKYASETVDYNSKIVPPTPPSKDGFDFAWEEYPETMPAHDITINGAYTTTDILSIAVESGKAKIFTLDGRQVDTPQKGINIIRMDDGTIKKVVLGK